MKFLKKFAGKWVATKGEKVIAASDKLTDIVQKVNKRADRQEVKFDLIPPTEFFAGHGI